MNCHQKYNSGHSQERFPFGSWLSGNQLPGQQVITVIRTCTGIPGNAVPIELKKYFHSALAFNNWKEKISLNGKKYIGFLTCCTAWGLGF